MLSVFDLFAGRRDGVGILSVIFLLGVFSAFTIPIVGSFPLSELILTIYGFWLIFSVDWQGNLFLRWCVALSFAWLAVQIATDIYRQIPLEDGAKGAARILTLMGCVFSLYWLLGTSSTRLGALLIGLSVAGGISYFFFPSTSAVRSKIFLTSAAKLFLSMVLHTC